MIATLILVDLGSSPKLTQHQDQRLVDLPGHVRLTAACFALLILGFGLLAQVNLWVQDGGGSAPGPEAD